MPRYSTYGARDDRVAEDGDRGFVGFNNRLRPDQLKPGILADSQNGRMGLNGEWEVRKGIDEILTPLVTTNALKLPFYLMDSDITTSSVAVTNNELILNFASAHGLGTSGSGQVELNTSSLTVNPATGSGPYVATIVDADTIKLTDKTYTSASGSVTITKPNINNNAVEGIYGSCAFSDPNDAASQYIVIATNEKAVAYNLTTRVSTDIAYPSSLTITSEVDMIQAFNKVFIFRDGQTALEWDGNLSNDFTKVESGEYTQPIQIVCAAGEFAIINGRGIIHQADGVDVGDEISCVGDKTLEADQTSGLKIGETFIASKIFTGGATQSITSATSTLISGGEYDGLNKVTATVAGHGYDIGDPIDIAGYTSPDTDINGPRFVAEKTTDTFVFYVKGTVSTTPSSGTPTVALAQGFEFFFNSNQTDVHITDGLALQSTPVFTKRISVGLGFTHMPAPPFAIYHQRRLVMPNNYTVNELDDSFTSNGRLDEIIASDILDTDTYDRIYANFRFNAGTADFVVGLHSFADDTLIVFNRNSIHLVQNSTVLKNAFTKLLTDEVGCLARNSIEQIGNRVLFLSDNGVYGIGFIEGYQLRGIEVPLSESIDSTIRRINKANQSKAISAYFDNRYYLAVPLNSEDGTQATENNAILIYNFLNQQWESIDSVATTGFHISNMFVAGNGANKGVYVVNDIGGVSLLESRVDGRDNVSTVIGVSPTPTQVQGIAKTRQFTFNNLDRKKWRSFEMHVESSPDLRSNFDIDAELENLDSTIPVGTLSSFNGGSTLQEGSDVSIRGRLGNPRAYGIQLDINNTVGRPKLRAVSVDGIESFRAVDKAE